MWNRGTAGDLDSTGSLPGQNMYSTHPFMMGCAYGQEFYYGIYWNNVAPVDYWLDVDDETEEDKHTRIRTRSTGGLGDILIFFSDDDDNSYDNLFRNYHKHIVGLPVMVPQWSFGWHQSKWGYQNTSEVREVIDNYSNFDLPLDVMWNDIDWMEDYRDFQADPDRYGDIKNLTDSLHEKNMYHVPIVDAGIAQREQTDNVYSQYMDGKDQDVFIKNEAGEFITGMVWPNDAVYPDFFKKETVEWWKNSLQ